MKIAIAKSKDVSAKWLSLPTDAMWPHEIRARVMTFLEEEERGAPEYHIVTLNRTILDLVTSAERKCPGPLSYEDVAVWNGSQLVPLLELHDEDWLVHFCLGDLLERGELKVGW